MNCEMTEKEVIVEDELYSNGCSKTFDEEVKYGYYFALN